MRQPGVLFHAAACAVWVSLWWSTAAAQVVLDVESPAENAESSVKLPGFGITIDESLVNAMSDFERYARRKEWEKAFRALSELPAEKRSGMLEVGDGFIVPARQRIWDVLAALPAEGREAFRVFFEAKAKQMFDAGAAASAATQPLDLSAAQQVFDEYFLTSVGDNAAELLGDANFELGKFLEADGYWKAVLEHHPDSDIPELRLHVKRAMALFRAGRTDGFDSVVRSMTQRFPDETMTIAGRDVQPLVLVRDLSRKEEQPPESVSEPHPTKPAATAPVAIPAEATEPAWQIHFLSLKDRAQLDQFSKQNAYNTRNGLETYVPPFVTDAKAIYVNWLGVCFAVDSTTGKLMWRSAKFADMSDKLNNLQNSGNLAQYAIAVSGDAVIAVLLPLDQIGQWQPPYRMTAFDSKTGLVRWTSEKVVGLQTTSFIGRPLIDGDRILVVSHQQQQTNVALHCLSAQDGASLWTHDLGNVQQVANAYGNQVMPMPTLTLLDGRLFILADNGALVQFDLQQRKVDWMYRFEAAAGVPEHMRWSGIMSDTTALHSHGCLTERDGILYFKEAASAQLFALDRSARKLIWKRPVSDSAMLVALDQHAAYLLSRELAAIDRQTREMKWSVRLPIQAGGLSAVATDTSLIVSTQRGLFQLSKQTGDVLRIFRGADLAATGGSLQLLGDQFISVTNQSLTAYPLKRE